MSSFACPVVRLDDVLPHPNADRLELAQIGGYRSIVKKGEYQKGDAVIYIPEDSIVPETILEFLGLTGRLAGPDKNRVRAIRLRGILSQGLVVPLKPAPTEGDFYFLTFNPDETQAAIALLFELGSDAASLLGIKKYEAPIPTSLAGEVWNAGKARTISYDVENIKRYPSAFQEGEEVVMTEKLHGTFCGVGIMPERLADPVQGHVSVFSKDLGNKGLSMQRLVEEDGKLVHNQANLNNLYLRATRPYLEQILFVFYDELSRLDIPVFVLGEVFGKGVQDLTYGADVTQDDIGFRVFDIYVGDPGKGRYLNDQELDSRLAELQMDRVPVLYRGPFTQRALDHYTGGPESLSGSFLHVREGVVVRPVRERYVADLGRVQLKSVSEDYLTRKGGTEYQ